MLLIVSYIFVFFLAFGDHFTANCTMIFIVNDDNNSNNQNSNDSMQSMFKLEHYVPFAIFAVWWGCAIEYLNQDRTENAIEWRATKKWKDMKASWKIYIQLVRNNCYILKNGKQFNVSLISNFNYLLFMFNRSKWFSMVNIWILIVHGIMGAFHFDVSYTLCM